MADDAKKVLQEEVVAVKKRWGDEVKLVKAAKDAPAYPLPLAVARTIPRPDAAELYDVDDLTVKLWVDSLEAREPVPVRVELSASLPAPLLRKIEKAVDERWRAELRARGSGKGFLLEKLLGWAESAFVELIELEPTFVDPYEACDEEGRTIRRYMITEPPPAPAEPVDVGDDDDSDEESSDDDGDDGGAVDPNDIDARVKNMNLDADAERQMRIKLKAEAEADRLYREARRKEAEEMANDNGPKPLSKKELAAQKEAKDTQGKRLRKAGAKANKFDAEAAGKKKNNKNGLLH